MLLLVDKPKGITSHDVIDRLRKITGEKRIGHAGTLDPNATGLLIVGVGRESTKKLGSIARDTIKTYIAEIILGEERDTDDIEGKILRHDTKKHRPDLADIKATLKKFEGEQDQVPPLFSAIKLQGKKAYDLARSGTELTLEPRKITVSKSSLVDYEFPKLSVEFCVSSGTYIRALARDIGRSFGTFAYLGNLRRTQIGQYFIKDALALDDFTPDNWKQHGI